MATYRYETDHDRGLGGETSTFTFPPTLIRWGAVFGGAVIAFAFMALWTSLWAAFANDPNTGGGVFEGSLNWWIGATGVVSMFMGGVIAGWLSGVRGFASGALHGLTTWGLLLIASLFIALPGTALANVQSNALFTLFWTLLIGMGTAVVGGVVGGLLPQPAGLALKGGTSRSATTRTDTREPTLR